MDNLASGWFINCTDQCDDFFRDTVTCKYYYYYYLLLYVYNAPCIRVKNPLKGANKVMLNNFK